MVIIEVRNLTKVYGRQVACRDICLSVEEGQIFGFLGPNGAGKSTLGATEISVNGNQGVYFVNEFDTNAVVLAWRQGDSWRAISGLPL
ncbi:MAG: ATP-binding cassette domain-containing protein, partial [Firmicutes bacterium]|nr:ATP-binding cassette domain-containing protein [Bacillota bacterium]